MLTRVGVPVELEAEPSAPDPQPNTLLCFSHLRWDFVFQRPQHLMSRFAKQRRVFFVEEPLYGSNTRGEHIRHTVCERSGVNVLTPILIPGTSTANVRNLLEKHLKAQHVARPIAWFYSPMWLDSFPKNIRTSAIVYDCMDELSLFKGAPP